ncbi:MAG: 30S ribosomal protein S12 methylthiotransferase RimO [Candidatus Margulisiibacteriota bacterium]
MKVFFVSLGCPKNLTDSEVLMGKFTSSGHQITLNPKEADTIVVNTCAFLKAARDEAAAVIREMAKWKEKGRCRQLLVAGCLPEYLRKIGGAIHESPVRRIDGIIDSINLYECGVPRIKATQPWFAYVKISEGCNNNCTYCLIPKIRGRLRHRKVRDILAEVKGLAKRGVKEIIYIAQDTTAYPYLARLLKLTAKIKGIRWIRLMYAHPGHLSQSTIKVMAEEKKIVKYIDLPIQHSEDRILRSMRRKYGRNTIEIQLKLLREMMPGIAIRTSVIVGFPGETERDFENLKEFIKQAKFDRLGVFPYSREKGTKAFMMKGQVPEKVKRRRACELMKLQAGISRKINAKLAGRTLEVLIEGRKGKDLVGRSFRDAPEIDGRVHVKNAKKVSLGEFIRAVISSSGRHDLFGKPAI